MLCSVSSDDFGICRSRSIVACQRSNDREGDRIRTDVPFARWRMLSYELPPRRLQNAIVVGLGGFEPPPPHFGELLSSAMHNIARLEPQPVIYGYTVS